MVAVCTTLAEIGGVQLQAVMAQPNSPGVNSCPGWSADRVRCHPARKSNALSGELIEIVCLRVRAGLVEEPLESAWLFIRMEIPVAEIVDMNETALYHHDQAVQLIKKFTFTRSEKS